jgi:hypothetical protein
MPVMKRMCKTCPFGPNGDPLIANSVAPRVVRFEGSHLCHHPILVGREETHLCRGARDIQLKLLAAFGVIDEPTDAAFDAKAKRLGVVK